jgi:hypothetical protein
MASAYLGTARQGTSRQVGWRRRRGAILELEACVARRGKPGLGRWAGEGDVWAHMDC